MCLDPVWASHARKKEWDRGGEKQPGKEKVTEIETGTAKGKEQREKRMNKRIWIRHGGI